MVITESLIDSLKVKASVLYINAAYSKYKHSGKPWIKLTPFHTALVLRRTSIIRRVIDSCNDSDVIRFFLNALINYDIIPQSKQPIHMEYLSLIKGQLSNFELQILGWTSGGHLEEIFLQKQY